MPRVRYHPANRAAVASISKEVSVGGTMPRGDWAATTPTRQDPATIQPGKLELLPRGTEPLVGVVLTMLSSIINPRRVVC